MGLGETSGNPFDLVVIGGGVNGVGVARDAAGRGLSVMLCEKDDLASHTSSSSSKLIHGGLRYLEHYDFKLVRHSLKEREVLLRSAPHIIWPMRFVLPHHRALRPRWLIRLGLFLYDHLAKRELLPGSKTIRLSRHPAGDALQSRYQHGFEYSDCWVEDARMVVLSAVDARERGADIRTRTTCTDLKRDAGQWQVSLTNSAGESSKVFARCVVNAAGPWVEQVARLNTASSTDHGVRLVKGSHIIVPSLFSHDYAYIFQNADDRIMFALPYESVYTLIGTTDVEMSDDPGTASISDEEIAYLCENASRYFEQPVLPDDVVATYSGVRPLFDDAAENASKATRDYVLHLDDRGAPIISVYGGKITTFRKLAEDVMEILCNVAGVADQPWTARDVLPGGDIPGMDSGRFLVDCCERWPWMDRSLVARLARCYGTRIDRVVGDASGMADFGRSFGAQLFQREVEYLVREEWAVTASDVLDRRTRLGLHTSENDRRLLGDWMADQAG